LYEGAIPDAMIAYGAIDKIEPLGCVGPAMNLCGRPIRYYSRPDPLISKIYRPGPIEASASLHGKKILYLAVEFENARYGPFRDVHPQTYLNWQKELLRWLEESAGIRPLVRLHPKRASTRYDPSPYQGLDRDMQSALKAADVFVIDYPTTTLAYAAATKKPVLFFDLGIRRLHPAAAEAIRKRCHHASTDILDSSDGLRRMQEDLSRPCNDTFTPLFSVPSSGTGELESVCDAVCDILS
jgi:hypothetical protein